MSYQVLARKYRPKSFQELVGQDIVARALTHALDENRLHHAYLFTGTRGVGKTTIARIFSRCLNCEQGVSANPCGVCGTCREIDEGRFVDLIEVDAASRTKVEDTRELLDNVQYAPTRGRYKVYLIDEVHMLSTHSFNALLKTLEEPPAHVKFLLATTDPQKLPVTILSRCLQFALKPMTTDRVVSHLKRVLGEENISYDEAALWLLARSAQGSMRDALSLTDQAIAFGHGALQETEVRALLGSVDRDSVYRVLEALQAGDGRQLLTIVASMADQSIDFAAALAELITVLHRLAVAHVVPDAIDNAEGDMQRLVSLAASLSPESLQLFYQMAIQGRRDLPLAVDPRAGFEMTLMRMMCFRPAGEQPPSSNAASPVTPVQASSSTSSASPAPAISGFRAGAASPSVLVTTQAEPAIVAPTETVVSETQSHDTDSTLNNNDLIAGGWSASAWADWVEHSGLTGAALNLARHSYLQPNDSASWALCLPPDYQMLAAGQAWGTLQAALARDFANQRIQLELVKPDVELPIERRNRLQNERIQHVEQALRQDPVVKSLMTRFDATLLTDTLTITQ